MKDLDTEILDVLRAKAGCSFGRRDLAGELRLQGAERKQLTVSLRHLVRRGVIYRWKGMYRLVSRPEMLEGCFSKTAQGYGFLRPENESQEDLFIPARHIGSAMNGDRVLVQLAGRDRSGRPFGRVVKVLERAQAEVLGIYQQQRGRAWVLPLDSTIAGTLFVESENSLSALPGQVVKLAFLRYPTATVAGSGRIVEVLGDQDDPQVDIETVIQKHNLPKIFSPEAIDEANELELVVSELELAHRTDLRELPLMTIDGLTAKDFDDAVSLCKNSDGSFRLWVCIADVAHYVSEGGALDRDARERGTSVYFPGSCLPMLPEVLSNGICSLKPQEDRLTMVAEMSFGTEGQRLSAEFYPAVIRSRARLTYAEVASALDGADTEHIPPEVAEQLPLMAELAKILTQMRQERGSLELDVPDVEIVLDDSGFPAGVVKSERTLAHRLIEEFMLAANEAVATFLEKRNYPFLYRIHEPPALDKLQEFQQLAAECGFGLVLRKDLQLELQKLLTQIADRPEARLLNQQLLRSLQLARYTPENKGHFGLAAAVYCHFTSPIRRYPDLTIHRTLKRALLKRGQKTDSPDKKLLELGQACSDRERRAMGAERDLLELRRCQLMKDKLGQRFFGTIASVTEFGFFVVLDELYIEGLVHVRSLRGDYYFFDPANHTLTGERRRKVFRVGMRVEISVERVELWQRRIDFALVECS